MNVYYEINYIKIFRLINLLSLGIYMNIYYLILFFIFLNNKIMKLLYKLNWIEIGIEIIFKIRFYYYIY